MIKFENIQIKYGDFIAIDNLNLEINEGEFFTFLGPSGCGKSTTLRALVGFLDPSQGRIEVNGKDVTKLEPEKRGIGIVFQSYALFPTMTVFDNIAFALGFLSKSSSSPKIFAASSTLALISSFGTFLNFKANAILSNTVICGYNA